MAVKFGRVSFINSIPLFCADAPAGFDILPAIPSKLNALTQAGRLDAALVSRWIYPSIADKYKVVPNFCIGGDGEIMSIKLFSNCRIDELGDKKIYITSQTGTSSRAFDYLCRKKYGYGFMSRSCADIDSADAVLLIGNSALAKSEDGYKYVYDLGELWKSEVGLPMIYAVFVVKNELFAELEPVIRSFAQKSLQLFAAEHEKFLAIAADDFHKDTGAEISLAELQKYYQCLKFKFDDSVFEKSFNFVSENGYL